MSKDKTEEAVYLSAKMFISLSILKHEDSKRGAMCLGGIELIYNRFLAGTRPKGGANVPSGH